MRAAAALAVTAAPTALAQVESYPTDRYVVAGDDFRAAGAMRLSDIFWFLDDWSTATVGQFRHDVSVRGLSPFAQQTWALFVDGMRHDLAQLGTINLNRLPVPITQIDSIVVLSVPQVHEGEWIDGGALHIYTRRAELGFNVGGHFVGGNETGETGPFFYTPLRTSNLERLGPDYSVHAGYAAPQLSADAGIFSLRHWLSDEKIVTRHQSARRGPLLVLIAPWARVEARLGPSSVTVFGGRSSVTDYLHLAEVGREIPVDNAFTTLGVAGRVPALVGAWGITYRLGHQVNALTPVENTLGVALGWTTRTSEGQVSAVHTTGSATTTVGGSIRRVTAVAGRDLSNASYMLTQVSFDRRSTAGGTINHRVGAAISHAGSGIGINASGSLTMAVGRNHRIRLALSASKQLSENDSRLWFWIPRGFTLLDDAGVPATSDGAPVGYGRVTVDLSLEARLSQAIHATVTGFVRSFWDVSLTDQRFAFVPADRAFASPVALVEGLNSTIVGAEFSARWRMGPALRMQSYYRGHWATGGHQLLRDSWLAVPRQTFRHRASYTPVPNFAIWAMFRYDGPSTWPSYADVAAQSAGSYGADLAARGTIDLAIEKWFGGRIIRTNLGIRNGLDTASITHPAGAALNLSLFVHVQLQWDGIGRANTSQPR